MIKVFKNDLIIKPVNQFSKLSCYQLSLEQNAQNTVNRVHNKINFLDGMSPSSEDENRFKKKDVTIINTTIYCL